VKSGDVIGKKVFGSEAQFLGKIYEIEFDTNTWTISDICIDVEKNVMETMGFQNIYDK
jgi:sporulation protein YlmC with PRC-barrel domain